jgi:hypothetical protein
MRSPKSGEPSPPVAGVSGRQCEAEEMLSGLANEGHVRVSANAGRIAYALWE